MVRVQMEAGSVICVQGPWGDMRWPTSLSLPSRFGTEVEVPAWSLQIVLKI